VTFHRALLHDARGQRLSSTDRRSFEMPVPRLFLQLFQELRKIDGTVLFGKRDRVSPAPTGCIGSTPLLAASSTKARMSSVSPRLDWFSPGTRKA
jgi:hypothetical protein